MLIERLNETTDKLTKKVSEVVTNRKNRARFHLTTVPVAFTTIGVSTTLILTNLARESAVNMTSSLAKLANIEPEGPGRIVGGITVLAGLIGTFAVGYTFNRLGYTAGRITQGWNKQKDYEESGIKPERLSLIVDSKGTTKSFLVDTEKDINS